MPTWWLNHRVFGDKPWAVQTEAMRRSEGRPKYAYWLEQGLGKTPLTFNDYIDSNDVDLMIAIAPNSFKIDWTVVPEEWGRPDIPAWFHPKHPVPWKEEVGVFALNYEAARTSLRYDLQRLLEERRCLLVIDEATAIKNYSSATFKAVLELAKRATRVRLLNGTPLAQNVLDYYAQLRCVGELNGWRPLAFRNRFAEIGGFMGKQIVGMKNEEELARILDHAGFRALKTDWRKDLPPQITVDPVHVEMTSKQARHYREMMEDFFTQVNDLDVAAELVLTQYDKLRQISSCILMSGEQAEQIEPPESNPKMNAVWDIHDSGPGKSIVVYWYKSSGEALFDRATKLGYKPAVIRGRMDPAYLLEEKRRFNDDPDCRVLIAQEDAACRGHTLIGGEGRNNRCSKTVYFENSFAYWQRAQMNDRNHRGAQDEPCNIYDIITSPMDKFALDTVREKKSLADRVDEAIALVRSRSWC